MDNLLDFLLGSQWPAGSMPSSPTGYGVGSFSGGQLTPIDYSQPSPQGHIHSLMQALGLLSPTPQPTPSPTPMGTPSKLMNDLLNFFTQRAVIEQNMGYRPRLHNYLDTGLGLRTRDKMNDILQQYGKRKTGEDRGASGGYDE